MLQLFWIIFTNKNKMTKILLPKIFTLLVLLTSILSCSDDNNEIESESIKLDLLNANAIYLAADNSSENSPQILYKITKDDAINELTIENEKDEDISNEIIDVCLMSSEFIGVQLKSNSYIVRLSDGYGFKLGNNTPREKRRYPPYFGEDFSICGNSIIYITENDKLIKLNTSNFENLIFEVLSETGDKVISFAADKDGTLIYTCIKDDIKLVKLRRLNGDINVMAKDEESCKFYLWTGLYDEPLFYTRRHSNDYIYTIEENPFKSYTYGEDVLTPINFKVNNVLKIKNKNKIITVDNYGFISELYSSNYKSGFYRYNYNLRDYFHCTSSSNFAYLSGEYNDTTPVLFKIDPNDYYNDALITDQYSINHLDATTDDYILFSGVDVNGDMLVIGKIDPSGNLNILEKRSKTEVKQLFWLD